ncbi:hypothetical protein CFN78_22815 [Amycolatopsis antarctica]|uniref:Uncharacterized protein n=1 Tax=Amycolatopsis antarctica TaxID=1854586 RepID=A0A263CXV6_9PSEU|nr:hypothetical protein [Amycolatopsis antarctica]OZM70984.1 hypothetical protein CFN78_22815 [Amycolatopsis antarctica]
MPLPHWTAAHLLPQGRHPADLADIYERLVYDAPQPHQREVLFSALSSYLAAVSQVMPSGRAWIGGNWTMRTEDLGGGVDVVLIPDDWGSLKRLNDRAQAGLYGLLTLRGVIVERPVMYLEQVQPVGGLLDGYLCYPGDEQTWANAWSSVRGPGGVAQGVSKGYPEVMW